MRARIKKEKKKRKLCSYIKIHLKNLFWIKRRKNTTNIVNLYCQLCNLKCLFSFHSKFFFVPWIILHFFSSKSDGKTFKWEYNELRSPVCKSSRWRREENIFYCKRVSWHVRCLVRKKICSNSIFFLRKLHFKVFFFDDFFPSQWCELIKQVHNFNIRSNFLSLLLYFSSSQWTMKWLLMLNFIH